MPCITIAIGTAFWSYSLPDIYRTSIVILVEAQQVPTSYVQPTISSPVRERLRTITQQVLSRTRLETVIRELHLIDDRQDRAALYRYLEQMKARINVKVKGYDAFTISYMGEEPNLVMLVTDKLASLYIEENLRVREQHAIGTTLFLAEELRGV